MSGHPSVDVVPSNRRVAMPGSSPDPTEHTEGSSRSVIWQTHRQHDINKALPGSR
ncbi:hypothetical protein J6590_031573 [Homalodisca vitripennis]|nr:hypothetical protein J6590_031573 [Homalodisca vitripennis]